MRSWGEVGNWGRAARLAVAAIAVSLLLAACGSSSPSSSSSGELKGTLTVFAAASLNGAFDQIGDQFHKANPGVSVKFNYTGSSTLATQIVQGAPADVFASANTQNMSKVADDKLVSGEPKVFVRNTLEIMVGAGNPKNITTLKDLANPAIKVSVCAPSVPCGSYSTDVFQKAGVTVNPVSEETSVSGVVTRVSLGEADAGIVYTTDVKGGGKSVQGVSIPAQDNVIADYPIAQLKDAPNSPAAAAFIKYVFSSDGQKVLADFGFMPVNQ